MAARTAGYGLRRNATHMKFRDADHQHVGLRKHPDFRFQSTLGGGFVLCLQGRLALIFHLHFPFSIVQSRTLCDRRPLKTTEGNDFSLLQRRKEIDSERSIKIRLVATLLAYLKTFKIRNSPRINTCTRCPDFMRINIPRCAWLWRGRNRRGD